MQCVLSSPLYFSTTHDTAGRWMRGLWRGGAEVPICLAGTRIGYRTMQGQKAGRHEFFPAASRLDFLPPSPPLPLEHRGDGAPGPFILSARLQCECLSSSPASRVKKKGEARFSGPAASVDPTVHTHTYTHTKFDPFFSFQISISFLFSILVCVRNVR
jgi:hypothetical protein